MAITFQTSDWAENAFYNTCTWLLKKTWKPRFLIFISSNLIYKHVLDNIFFLQNAMNCLSNKLSIFPVHVKNLTQIRSDWTGKKRNSQILFTFTCIFNWLIIFLFHLLNLRYLGNSFHKILNIIEWGISMQWTQTGIFNYLGILIQICRKLRYSGKAFKRIINAKWSEYMFKIFWSKLVKE